MILGSVVFGDALGSRRIIQITDPNTPKAAVETVQPCERFSCSTMLETLARESIAETAQWKRELGLPRKGQPMVYSLYGCCGCEVTVDAKGEWVFTTRPLTQSEQASFKEEYGNQAPLMLAMNPTKSLEIRGYVLNGRREGWNLSVRITQ